MHESFVPFEAENRSLTQGTYSALYPLEIVIIKLRSTVAFGLEAICCELKALCLMRGINLAHLLF
jgi:hypothetical protein